MFTIFGAIEDSMKNRILHLEPGTIGFNSYTPAEYLEEMLGRFMNARRSKRKVLTQETRGGQRCPRILQHEAAVISTRV